VKQYLIGNLIHVAFYQDRLAQQQLQIVGFKGLPANSPNTILPNLGQVAFAAALRSHQGQDTAMPIGPAI